MITPDRAIDPPDNEPDEIEIENCANCNMEDGLFELGIERPGLGLTSQSMVCSGCLNELHQ